MGKWIWLATEAEHGFGLHFDLLESNLINLVLIIGLLVYFGKNFLGGMLQERRARIEEAIAEAEQRARESAEALSDAQQKLSAAQKDAERIRAEAEQRAETVRQELLAQNAKDIERMKESATQEVSTERDRAIAELRQRVAAMALERVESRLGDRLNDSNQSQLIDRTIARIGGGA